jgi:hypothetical protein
MDWVTFLGAIGGSAAVATGVAKFVGDRLIERQKAHYAEHMAAVAHERTIFLAERQNAFSVGATSHMAAVVFDKHIAFCEQYIRAMSKSADALIREEAEPFDTGAFFRIRQKWALWLNPDIEANLERFEIDFAKIGAAQFLGGSGSPVSNELSFRVGTAIAYLRTVLDTRELGRLRKEFVARALKNSPAPDDPT